MHAAQGGQMGLNTAHEQAAAAEAIAEVGLIAGAAESSDKQRKVHKANRAATRITANLSEAGPGLTQPSVSDIS